MIEKYFSILYDAAGRHRRLIASVIILIIIASGAGVPFIPFSGRMESMLPADDEIIRDMNFLRESDFSGKILLSLKIESPEHSLDELIAEADTLARTLEKPLITRVESGASSGAVRDETLLFMRYAPQLVGEDELNKIGQKLTPEGVKENLSRIYRQMLSPASSFMAPLLRADPLGFSSVSLKNLLNLSGASGYEINFTENHFISRDGRHLMLILDTPVDITDSEGSRELIGYLKDKISKLPGHISCAIIAGHTHAVSNEDVIKRDIAVTSVTASIAFLAIFLFNFRDYRAVIFFLIPLFSVLISMNISALVFGRLSYFVAGMGAVIIGIADDYGIHVYTAVRTSGRIDSVKEVARPLMIAVLTTISVFVAFFFSNVSGYHELAFFAIVSILLCLGFVLFVFPYIIASRPLPFHGSKREVKPLFAVPDGIKILLWLIIAVIMTVYASGAVFDNDVQRLDGAVPEIVNAENEFHRVWGGKYQPAFFVVSGRTEEEALKLNEKIYWLAARGAGKDLLTGIAPVFPSEETRRANELRWKNFWQAGRTEKLRDLIREEGKIYNFSDKAFEPFFAALDSGRPEDRDLPALSFLIRIKERFIHKYEGGFRVISFFPDTKESVSLMNGISKDNPGTFIVSRRSFSDTISRAISREVLSLASIAGIMILGFTLFCLKSIKLTLISLVPVMSAAAAVPGGFSFLNIPLTAPSIIASMVVVGLCIDYGVFMLYSFHHELDTGTEKAIWVSALTTIVGAFSLLFASHPVLYAIGLTLTIGLTAGYLAAQFIVPALYRIWFVKR
jgi:predicted exporter